MSHFSLPRTSPESVGVSSGRILEFLDAIERDRLGMHSLMILRQGQVIAEGWWSPYERENLHLLWSLSKSFTSTAVGFAVQEGRMSVQDKVVSFFPEKVPENPSENLLAMTVQSLLTMSCGHENDDMTEMYMRTDGDWVRGFLEREVPHRPGTHFLYNSSASFVLSAIVQRVVGETVLDYLRPRLLEPLGIKNATWELSPEGICMGGWGMSLATESIARFGQFLLQKGTWNEVQILSSDWIEEATGYHVSNEANEAIDWKQGYGYQFWRAQHGAYRGDGAFGQFCVVAPAEEIVVAITSASPNMQSVLTHVWNHIVLPAEDEPLAESDSAVHLTHRLSEMVLEPGVDSLGLGLEDAWLGTEFKATEGGPYDRLSIHSNGEDYRIDLGKVQVRFGLDRWVNGVTDLEIPGQEVSARATRTGESTLEICVVHLYSAYTAVLMLTFGIETVELKTALKYRFGPSEGPSFVGRRG